MFDAWLSQACLGHSRRLIRCPVPFTVRPICVSLAPSKIQKVINIVYKLIFGASFSRRLLELSGSAVEERGRSRGEVVTQLSLSRLFLLEGRDMKQGGIKLLGSLPVICLVAPVFSLILGAVFG
jgi:hypothetical protein